jgi:hypothetical protein
VNVTLSNSTITNTGSAGITVTAINTLVMIRDSTISNNGSAMDVSQGTVRIGRSTITNNGNNYSNTPFAATGGGLIQSYGDNYIRNLIGDAGPPKIVPQ